MAKSAKKNRSRDRKLVAGRQKHEVRYTAKKAGVKGKSVKRAVKRVGHSRKKIEKVLKTVKKAVKRMAQSPKKVVQALSPTPVSNPPGPTESESLILCASTAAPMHRCIPTREGRRPTGDDQLPR